MKKVLYAFASCLILISCKEKLTEKKVDMKYLDASKIEILDPELQNILDPNQKLEILSEGHDWTEGPLWLETENKLIFSDIPRNSIYSWEPKKGVKEYLKPSGYIGEDVELSKQGANGLLLNAKGELILCQHGARQVARMDSPLSDPKPVYLAVADTYSGKRLNSPNDAVYDTQGNLYFTDPPYGLPKGTEDPTKELDFQGVFRVDTQGDVQVISQALSRPNGIAFSPDEKQLYVANSDPEKAIWMVYELDADGKVQSEKLFFDATQLVASEKGLPDGLKVNAKGYVFATGPGGVFIFNPSGKHLGTIKTGQATSNCAFNDDETVLFMTADSYVLSASLK